MEPLKCRWCGAECPAENITRLRIFLPFYEGPRFDITNDLCEDCSRAAREALAAVEQAAMRGEKV